MTSIETPMPAKPPGPSLRVSIVLMLAGLALSIPTLVAGIVPIVRAVEAPVRFNAPGTVSVHLGRGTYMVYEDTGSVGIGSTFSPDDTVTITPSDVTVTDSAGVSIEVFDRGSLVDSRSSDGDRFVGAVRFTTPAAGDYTVKVDNATPKAVLVARPLSDAITHALGWFALAGVGGLIVILGLVLLIVGSARRSRAHGAFAYAASSPPGWYPDPGGSGRLRYWDGYRWTEHLH